MSSKIEIKKSCEYCGNDFIARTTVTRYCGEVCSKRTYKSRKRAEKINAVINQVSNPKSEKTFDERNKDFLTVKETAKLLSCSIRTVYYYIEHGSIPARNLGSRLTRIKRSSIDKLFDTCLNKEIIEKKELIIFDISKMLYNFRGTKKKLIFHRRHCKIL
ncbi:helix-turn-helix domain-containing protein [Chryseobacterium luquanense]|uniref:Helix-turn-helix domain-containing protein n=1 Tax=Chryseobacterium luquanense TaxID=2983766 RepID=A0ABT3Y8N2_9FLAO|nr:helix-turn-helix domain-containing protein [Chryseobacterium luquanense]MCX8534336.1 helix-turn-helix domain-containing protein [Chryseobacterium luquanense]